jgi:hypothetical protein
VLSRDIELSFWQCCLQLIFANAFYWLAVTNVTVISNEKNGATTYFMHVAVQTPKDSGIKGREPTSWPRAVLWIIFGILGR